MLMPNLDRNFASVFGKLKIIWRLAEFVVKFARNSLQFQKLNKLFIIQFIFWIHSLAETRSSQRPYQQPLRPRPLRPLPRTAQRPCEATDATKELEPGCCATVLSARRLRIVGPSAPRKPDRLRFKWVNEDFARRCFTRKMQIASETESA